MARDATLTEFATSTETPAQEQYDRITDDEELIEYSREYAEYVVEEHDMDIDLSLVMWNTSRNTKRMAAATRYYSPNCANTGIPIDWEKAREMEREKDGQQIENDDEIDDYRECVIKLSWSAFDAFDRDQWEGTIRHELVHVEQHQRYGTADHGLTFKTRAREVDAPVECPEFSQAKYHLHCSDCGELDVKRHRKSKTVKHPEKYRSNCCNAPLEVELGPDHEDYEG